MVSSTTQPPADADDTAEIAPPDYGIDSDGVAHFGSGFTGKQYNHSRMIFGYVGTSSADKVAAIIHSLELAQRWLREGGVS